MYDIPPTMVALFGAVCAIATIVGVVMLMGGKVHGVLPICVGLVMAWLIGVVQGDAL